MPFSFICVWYAYVLLWDTDFFYEVRDLDSIVNAPPLSFSAPA